MPATAPRFDKRGVRAFVHFCVAFCSKEMKLGVADMARFKRISEAGAQNNIWLLFQHEMALFKHILETHSSICIAHGYHRSFLSFLSSIFYIPAW